MSEFLTSCLQNVFRRLVTTALLVSMLLCCGCLNSLVMLGKVVMGDPKQPSGFELATGISLEEENKRILIHCVSPSFVTSEYDSLTADVQEEVIRRMKRRGMAVLHPDAAANILDNNGGTFDPNLLAAQLDDVDYIMLVTISGFQYRVDQSPNLFQGKASGRVIGYEVVKDDALHQTLKIYDQEFQSQYPIAHPIASDQMPKNVFIRRFIDQIADDVGSSFYKISQSELFAR